MEIWKPIKNHEGFYEVSNKGRVRSLDREIDCADGCTRTFRGQILAGGVAGNGYRLVNLRGEKRNVHRLVAETFLEKPADAECTHHVDGDKLNNRVSNLEWVTYQANNQHARQEGLNNQHGENCNLTIISSSTVAEIRRLGRETDMVQREIADRFGISRPTVSDILNYKSRRNG